MQTILNTINSHFGGSREAEWILTAATVLGCFKLLSAFVRFPRFLLRHFWPISKNRLYSTYAHKNSWALVTGGSDGIGFAMC
jgi:hypothetical protein